MKYLLLFLLLGGTWYAYDREMGPFERPFTSYDQSNLAADPMPSRTALKHFHDYAEQALCTDKKFQQLYQTNQASCLAKLSARYKTCLTEVPGQLPTQLNNDYDLKQAMVKMGDCIFMHQVR